MPTTNSASTRLYRSKISPRQYNHRRHDTKQAMPRRKISLARIKQILREFFNHRQYGTSRPKVHISNSTYSPPSELYDYPSSPLPSQCKRAHGPAPRLRSMPFICGPDSEPNSLSISPINIDTSSSDVNSPVSPLPPLKCSAGKPASEAKIRRMLADLYNGRRLGISHRNGHISISQRSSLSNPFQVRDKDYLTPPMPLPQDERIHGPESRFVRMPFCGPNSQPSSPPISPISNDGSIPCSRFHVSPLSQLERLAASWRKELRILPHPNLSPSAAYSTAILNLPMSPSPSRRLSLAPSIGSEVSFVSALEYPATPAPQFTTMESRCFSHPEVRPSSAASTTAMSNSPRAPSSNLIPSLDPSIRSPVVPSSPIQRSAVPNPQPAVRDSRCFPNPYSRPSSDASTRTIWNFPPPSRRASLEDSPDVRPSSRASATSQHPRNTSRVRPPPPSIRPAASGPDFAMQESKFASPRSSNGATTTTAVFGYLLERWSRRCSSLEYFSGTSSTSDAPALRSRCPVITQCPIIRLATSRTRYPIIPASPILRPSAPSPESALRGYRLSNPRPSVSAASTTPTSHLPPFPSPHLPPTTPPPATSPPHTTTTPLIHHNTTHTTITITPSISLQHLWTLALTALRLWDGEGRARRGAMMVTWRGRGMYWDKLLGRTVITEENVGWVLEAVGERGARGWVEVVLF